MLSSNYNKTKFIHLRTTNVYSRVIPLDYDNRCVTVDLNIEFLAIILDNTWYLKKTDALIMKLRAVG